MAPVEIERIMIWSLSHRTAPTRERTPRQGASRRVISWRLKN